MTFSPSEARPVFAHLPHRTRLLDHVGRHAGALLLSAPSGWGKTVFASQLADQSSDVMWWDCLDRGIEADMADPVVRRAEEWSANRPFGGQRAESAPRCVVLDNLTLTCAKDVARLAAVRAALSDVGWRLVATTRSCDVDGPAEQHGFHVLTHRQLAIDPDEATTIWQMSRMCPRERVDSILRVSAGHPAMFSLLLRFGDAGERVSTHDEILALIDSLAMNQLTAGDMSMLMRIAVLGAGEVGPEDLVHVPMSHLRRLEAAIPLVSISADETPAGTFPRFDAHSLLLDWTLSRLSLGKLSLDDAEVDALVRRLIVVGKRGRAFRLALAACAERQFIPLLEEHGRAALQAGLAEAVDAMLSRTPLAESMARPALMLLWAEALLACGRADDALGKARAARTLAEHAGDTARAAAAGLAGARALEELNRWPEARSELGRMLGGGTLDDDAEAQAHIRSGLIFLHLLDGDPDEAIAELARLEGRPAVCSHTDAAAFARAVVLSAAYGDFNSAAALAGPLISSDSLSPYERVVRKGTLSAMLTETGRLERASALLDAVEAARSPLRLVQHLKTRGMILAGLGEPSAISALELALRHAVAGANDSAAAEVRTCLSVVQRSEGLSQLALVSAERAHEALCIHNVHDCRRLASLEVAASLLALGDATAARSRAEAIAADGFGCNRYHGLRCALVLSECDRMDGKNPSTALHGFEDYITSGSANWQLAMFCRAFPGLIGTLAATVGVDSLPAQMLRMVLPDQAEISLRAARSALPEPQWLRLGDRLLGAQLMAAFVARGIEPVCHVRLFGGLSVNIDGREIQEQVWRKKKSRLLFAMLVARRGQDVARDQILEHLWPNLNERRAKNNFYVVWSMMKSALMGSSTGGRCPYVESARGRCRIVRDAVRSDIDDFEDALVIARRAEADGDLERAIRAYERVGGLYRGDLLPGDVYDDWFAPLRDHYRFQFIDAMVKVAELLLERDRPNDAITFARRGIAADSSREDLYQLALRAYIAAGQRSTAIETFMQCKYRLSEELGLDPSSETMRLYSEILSMEERPRDPYGLDFSVSPEENDVW